MSLLDDRSIIILGNGIFKTRFRNGELMKPTYKYENFPVPEKSGDSDKSSDKATKPANVNINVVIKTQ